MIQQFYYGHEGREHGPCTATQLRELALAGKILISDFIWKEGAAYTTPASSVKNLFSTSAGLAHTGPAAPADALAELPQEQLAVAPAEPTASQQSEAVAEAPAAVPVKTARPARMARALALVGAKITGQDGTTVQFKKICTKCGHEDAARSTMKLRIGVTRLIYYCPKCRKPREVSIQGMS
jgi:hypothetical protein